MAKKRLYQIAKECEIPFEEAMDLAFKHLEEDMITGAKHLTWINEKGQEILDDVIPMPNVAPEEEKEPNKLIYRGKVLRECPNPMYVAVHHRERFCKVNVKITKRMQGQLIGKMIYFEERNENNITTYHWIKKI
tara:strand:+ start:3157 stop:3558 length:402 start_codon:yes stop_codon:yes gene_type:complete